jgi:hypothetical protein
MKLVSVSVFALLAPAYALLRFPCAQLVIDRLDPLVTPGQSPSPHLHQILGGVSSTKITMNWRLADIVSELLQRHHGPRQRYAKRVDLHIVPIQRRLFGRMLTFHFATVNLS